MTAKSDDKELMAAFAEFKEMLRRDVEPGLNDPSHPPPPPITVERYPAPPAPAAPAPEVAAPKMRAGELDRALAGSIAPKIATPPRSDEAAIFAASEDVSADRRRKLIYLSAAIVVLGLGALGWTLSQWRGPEEQLAVARTVTPPSAPEADAAVKEPVGDEAARPSADAAALDTLADHASDPAKDSAPPPMDATPAPADQSGKTPASSPTATTGDAAAAAPALRAAVPPAQAPAAAAPAPASPLPKAASLQPAAPPQAKATVPVGAEAPAAAAPATEPRAAQAKPVKPKVKPPAQGAERAKPKPGKTARSATDDVSAPATALASPPPAVEPTTAPAQSDGGAFGFVKRTVNSVGSTIGTIGRNAAGMIP